MSEKTVSSKQLLYIGIGKNKYYTVTPTTSNLPIEFFPYGLFLRFSQDKNSIQELVYDFFETPTQKSLLPKQRDILLDSQYFGINCYIDCYFKSPPIILSFLEKFNQLFIFKESGSNMLLDLEALTARLQSLN